MNNDMYIYNLKQANYFINHGLIAEGIGLNKNKVYVKFNKNEELYRIFEKWNKKEEISNSNTDIF